MLVFINHTVDLLQNNNPGNKSIYTKNSQRNWLENQKGGGSSNKGNLHDFDHVLLTRLYEFFTIDLKMLGALLACRCSIWPHKHIVY